MSYKKLKPIEGGTGGCGNCGYQHNILPMDSLIAVGFGYAAVTKNGQEIYRETEEGSIWNTQNAENEARKDPDNDWRIHLEAPLSERHYQRQGKNHWALYKKGIGFA
jgi:hypothetical protein